jgi:hypothetical protein
VSIQKRDAQKHETRAAKKLARGDFTCDPKLVQISPATPPQQRTQLQQNRQALKMERPRLML